MSATLEQVQAEIDRRKALKTAVAEKQRRMDAAESQADPRSGRQTIGDVVGTVPLGINAQREALKTMVTGAIAQPIAGLVGLGQTLNPFAEPGAGARAVNQVQDALTYQPDASGQQILEGHAEMLQPVTDAIDMARTAIGLWKLLEALCCLH